MNYGAALYTIKAYISGLSLPTTYGKTGCFKLASKMAQDIANEEECTVIVLNNETGNKTLFGRRLP